MIEIGKYHKLRIVKIVDFGVYLDGGEETEILLPRKYVSQDCAVDNIIEVFIYHDSEGRLIATTQKPLATRGQFAFLKVKSMSDVGAFLDWGLPRDLFIPFREQKRKMVEGKYYVVYIYLDEQSNRLAASTRIDRYIDKTPANYEEYQAVNLLIYDQTDLGYKAIINNCHTGIIYQNEVFQLLSIGQSVKGFVKKIRDDGKIDLCLAKPGHRKIDNIAQKVLAKLLEINDYVEVSDRSDPELIYQLFGISKKSFKKALGMLYKQKLIDIRNDEIRLIDK